MSQIQVTGEAKIRDLQGPVVANAGVITALDGSANQYVRGDGALASFPTVTGGGSSVSLYLNGSVNQGTFGGSTYYQLGENAITGVGTNFSTSTNGLLAQFITDANVPDQTEIPSGNWNIEFYMGVSASSGSLASFYVEIYKYNGTTFTLIGTNVTTPEFLTNTTTVDAYFTSVAMPLTALAQTDRIAVRVFANVASKTVTLYTEDNRLCQVVTTFSRGILSLNNLTDQQQYFGVGTSGTDFNIVSSVDTHTFNIPSASAINRGLITTGTQTIAGAKTFTGFNSFTGNTTRFSNGAYFDKGGSPSGLTTFTTNLYSESGSNNLVIADNDSNAKLQFQEIGDYDYTFPALSGTLALTSDLSSYVPYSGATANVDLGSYNIFSNNVYAEGDGASTNGGVLIKQYSGAFTANSGYTSLFATPNQLGLNFGGIYSAFLQSASLTASRTYTFPDASGTIALTSNLSSYVPYTGATGPVNLGIYALSSNGLNIFGSSVFNANSLYQKAGLTAGGLTDYITVYHPISGNGVSYYDGTSLTSASLVFDTTGSRTYTFPALTGTIALLEGSQTFTGAKTFSASVVNDDGLKIKFGSASNLTANYLTLSAYGLTSPNRTVLRLGTTATTLSELYFSQLSSYQYTFPASSGTLALTSNIPANIVTGTGTTNTLPKFTGTSAIGNSNITDTGSLITLGSNSYVNGALGIGSTNLTQYSLRVEKGITGSIISYAVRQDGTVQTDVTNTAYGFSNTLRTLAASFTLSNYTHYDAGQGTLGAGSSVTNQTGFLVQSGLISATNNYGFRGSIPSGTNRWNLYMDGTASNYLAGKLLIGSTTDNGAALQVTGAATFSSSVTVGGSYLEMNGSGLSAPPAGLNYGLFPQSSIGLGLSSLYGMTFWTGTTPTERMRITSAGALLVGTTSNDYGSRQVNYSSTSYTLHSIRTGTGSEGHLLFQNGNGVVGSIFTNGSATFYNATSDYRLKEDLKDYNGIDLVCAIKTYDYQWKSDKSRMYGVMAHELAEIIPYAVTGKKDDVQMQSVDYSKIVPILIKSIQELQAKIVTLESKIN